MRLYSKLREIFDEKIAIKLGEAIEEELSILEKIVTKDEFYGLKQIVNELAESQKKSEERLSRLEIVVQELAEAQKRTEERLKELAEAQKKTEKEIEKLTKTVGDLQDEVGGLSHSFGHILEDKAIVKLPSILKEKYGIELKENLKRDFLENERGEREEVNFFGFGSLKGEKVFIIGEGKSRFSKNDLIKFLRKIKRFGEKYGKPFPIVVTYIFSKPEIKDELKNKDIKYFISYELE